MIRVVWRLICGVVARLIGVSLGIGVRLGSWFDDQARDHRTD